MILINVLNYTKKADYILSRKDYGTIPLYYGKLQFVAKPYVKKC